MSNTWREWEGQIVDGRFPLIRHLGGSDHSVVFLTERGSTDQPQKAAIKFLHADDKSPAQLAIWEQTAQISHASLIRIFESGRCTIAGMDLLYVVVDYVEENLAQFLPERALSTDETRQMLEPALDALACLHGKGFVHSRIRPGNVMATGDQLKLSSDALCRIGERRGVTKNLDIYSPPEAANEMSLRTGAGDVWSLGITLVEALTQHPPQVSDTADPIVPDSMPEPFGDIARSALRREPKSRASVADILSKLNPQRVVATPPAEITRELSTPPENPVVPAPAKRATFDPLSLSLSPVAAPPPAKRQSEKPKEKPKTIAASGVPARVPPSRVPTRVAPHTIPRTKTSSKSYYVVVIVLLAATVAAAVAIPRLRNLTATSDTATPDIAAVDNVLGPPSQPGSAPNASQLHSKSKQKPGTESTAQPSALSANAGKSDSMQNMSDTQPPHSDSTTPVSSSAAAPSTSSPTSGVHVRESLDSSAGVTHGEVLNEVIPDISSRSKQTIHGTVKVALKAHVDASGAITNLVPETRASKFFTEAAMQAARRWDFAPAKMDGHAVPSEWLLRFEFTQADSKVFPSQLTP
jgi:serine/threonine protein kinase